MTGDYLDQRLQNRVLGTYSVEYGNEQGLNQLVERAESQILDAKRREEREVLDEFFKRLRGGTTVGNRHDDIEKAIEYGAVDTAIVSTTVPRERRKELEETVRQLDGDVCIVSTETERGSQFAETFNGVSALLRFAVQ